jgi:hypothetical protein
MKKILNLSTNEMCDIEREDVRTFVPAVRIGDIATISSEISYIVKNKPAHWKDTDTYKIIEV